MTAMKKQVQNSKNTPRMSLVSDLSVFKEKMWLLLQFSLVLGFGVLSSNVIDLVVVLRFIIQALFEFRRY